MKKLVYILIIFAIVLVPSFNVEAKTSNNKVVINVFYAEWCSNCTNLHNFLNEFVEDKEYNKMFEIKYYRIDNQASYGENEDYEYNTALYEKVSAYFNNGDEGYIPFYVIGDSYEVGYSSSQTPDLIKKMVKESYYDSDYVDIVSKIENGEIDVTTTVKVDEEAETKENDKKLTNIIGIIVIVITLLAVIGIIVASIINKRK